MQSFGTFLFASLFFITSVLSFDIESQNNIAVYWGQNSEGGQQRLSEYCQSSNADIFILSFLTTFPNNLGLNFANACSETFGDNSGLLHCSTIAADIETCQSLGKKVLLSLGGASGAYGFTNNDEAEAFAETLWNTFGEGTTTDRPFDSAVVDGFDFDIENNNNVGYAALVNKLRDLFKKGSKQYYISAAPQCPYPDYSVGDLLANAEVDFAFIQFYNNYCNVDKQFNWNDWEKYASTVSPNPNIKLFLGLPGSPRAAGSGFISDLALLQNTVNSIKSTKNFAGIAIWDASQGYSYQVDGKSYIENVENILKKAEPAPSTTTSTSSAKTTTTLSPVTTSSTTTSKAAPAVTSTSITTSTSETTLISSSKTEKTSDNLSTSIAHHTDTKASTALSSTIVIDTITSTTKAADSTTTQVVPTTTTPSAPATSSVKITTTLSPATPVTPITTTTVITPVSPTTPATTTTVTTTTPTLPVAPTTTNPSATTPSPAVPTTPVSPDTPVHQQAQQLNQLYAEGKFNGKSKCTDGEMSCSQDGKFAICNFGEWVIMGCASGTTCYSYDQDGQLFTQCGYPDLKNNFI